MRDPIIPPDSRFSWERFWIHLVFGLLIGGVTGICNFGTETTSWFVFGLSAIIPGLVVGVLGGLYGDEFWKSFFEIDR
jgi:hypothetical protein